MPAISVPFEQLKREKLFKYPPKDKSAFPALQAAVLPHLDSFNELLDDGALLKKACDDIGTKVVFDGSPDRPPFGNKLSMKVHDVFINKPEVGLKDKSRIGSQRRIYPAEARERHITYRGNMTIKLMLKVNDGAWVNYDRDVGNVPIMLRSTRCHLHRLSPAQLAAVKEETEELGGYFIVNGIEKLIRMLVVQRRNHPMAIIRNSFTKRGSSYSNMGVQIRCVRPDQTSQSIVLHYLNDGGVMFRFSWRKNEYLIPVVMILKALAQTSDKEIFEELVPSGERENTFLTDRVESLLRSYKKFDLYSREETLQYLGDKFRRPLAASEDMTNEEVGIQFLRKVVLVHLSEDRDKFHLLLFMIRKLYSMVAGDCAPDNPDAVQHQEILLGGFLYGMIIKERIEKYLDDIRAAVRKDVRDKKNLAKFSNEYLMGVLAKTNSNLGGALEYFLSTGNLASPSGLDLQQVSGFTVVAEKINFYRFISHFRMVHRGSFFAQMKTTTVRKLLPESWGFLCPVHTPDGSPCGLLNHLAHKCRIMTSCLDVEGLDDILFSLGVIPPDTIRPANATNCIQLDGRIVGWCTPKQTKKVAETLRFYKVKGIKNVPLDLEIGYIPPTNKGQYPGLYLFSQQARMVRPVKYLALDKEDSIGPFEQPYMSIAVKPEEIETGETTHVEFTPTNIFSIVANMTPFSDFNQSPRNMYQCQMGKQTMGTPGTSLCFRDDNKLYRLQTGQSPVVRSPLYHEYGLDNFPNGTNCVVAVISYTGYDMDDAMIINKSALERGFGYGTVYKTEILGWKEENAKNRKIQHEFGLTASTRRKVASILELHDPSKIKQPKPATILEIPEGASEEEAAEIEAQNKAAEEAYAEAKEKFLEEIRTTKADRKRALSMINKSLVDDWFDVLDLDGFASIGAELKDGSPLAVYHDIGQEVYKVFAYKSTEQAFVDEIRILPNNEEVPQQVTVKMRVPRSPQIGDKFSSRHGQKGVCSQKWPAIDMPFSETGMQPDIIINPHAFPSRMTIGMFVESLAGKAGALHGMAQNCTPFQFDENQTAADYFGKQLRKAGYNYHGNEPMYSGITGEELYADIYIGVVYYQRLRHMVNDKFQVRTTGKIDKLTHQPIKGRKKGGGIRVGEMERDSLLAHGTAYLLQDRLLNCSDYTQTWVCRDCGSLSSTSPTIKRVGFESQIRCRRCAERATGLEDEGATWEDGMGNLFVGGENTTVVAIPFVLKYLDAELEAMGIKMKFNVTE